MRQHQSKHVDVIHADGFALWHRIAGFPGGRVGAVVEQQLQRRHRANDAGADDERGAAILGPRVDVGAGVEEHLHLAHVRQRGHQRRHAGRVGGVGIGSRRQQPAHQRGVAVERGCHQRCSTEGAPQRRDARIAQEQRVDGAPIVASNRSHQPSRVGIDGERRCFSRHGVGPHRSLVNPALDDLDLLVAERPCRRHLRTERGADQAVKQTAAARVAGTDVRLTSAAQGVRPPIEPQAAELLRGTVTADAMLTENRLNVALEIDAGGRLAGRRQRHCSRSEREQSGNHGP